ncbi:hypothetical protein ACWEO4_11035 [Streptomyces sp. NPDC004393]
MHEAAGFARRELARKTMLAAISSGDAGRPAGASAARPSRPSPGAAVPSVRVGRSAMAGAGAATRENFALTVSAWTESNSWRNEDGVTATGAATLPDLRSLFPGY